MNSFNCIICVTTIRLEVILQGGKSVGRFLIKIVSSYYKTGIILFIKRPTLLFIMIIKHFVFQCIQFEFLILPTFHTLEYIHQSIAVIQAPLFPSHTDPIRLMALYLIEILK